MDFTKSKVKYNDEEDGAVISNSEMPNDDLQIPTVINSVYVPRKEITPRTPELVPTTRRN
jgi:hypothetical protein